MYITTYKSVHQAYVDQEFDLSWDEAAELLTTHIIADAKEDVPLYSLVKFKPVGPDAEQGRKRIYVNNEWTGEFTYIPNTVRRCKGNVLEIHGIVLDIDDTMSILDVAEKLDGLEYVLYTTFRHTPEKHKFRVVIPFSRPLLPEDVVYYKDSIVETFPGVDHASFTLSQGFYFHSGNTDPLAFRNTGQMIDPYAFERKEPPVIEYTLNNNSDFTAEQAAAYKETVIASLMTCSGLHYHSTASQYGVLTLVGICRSAGMTFEEYDEVCLHIADPSSSLKTNASRKNAWLGWEGNRITRGIRDAFIKAYGGKPIPTRESRQMEYKELVSEMQMLRKIIEDKKNGKC